MILKTFSLLYNVKHMSHKRNFSIIVLCAPRACHFSIAINFLYQGKKLLYVEPSISSHYIKFPFARFKTFLFFQENINITQGPYRTKVFFFFFKHKNYLTKLIFPLRLIALPSINPTAKLKTSTCVFNILLGYVPFQENFLSVVSKTISPHLS